MGPVLKDRVFRDPVHGLIEFRGRDRHIAALLETRPFQRLRRIRQMGFAWLVYPGAEHSRFGHALGAYHVAGVVANQLRLDAELARDVRVAALLHDIGHGPFSHTWEQVFAGDDHEAWGARIAREDSALSAALAALDDGLGDRIAAFFSKQHKPAYARKLVSSQLDADRLDYLLRDGHYSGARYATFDLEWILHALQLAEVRDDPDDPVDLVIDYRRGMYAVEQYLFARTYMYAQVYHHKTVRSAEWMFLKLLRRFVDLARAGCEPGRLGVAARLARGESISVEDYLWLDDVSLFAAMDDWAGRGERGAAGAASDPVVRDLARRLVDRRLFKTMELGKDPAIAAHIEPMAAAAAADAFGDAAPFYYHIDTARQVGYAPTEDEELYVVGHPVYGTVTLGRLLQDLPLGRPTSTLRLVCAPELVDVLRPAVAEALAGASV